MTSAPQFPENVFNAVTGAIRWLLKPALREEAERLHNVLVAQARRPEFFTKFGVADTIDGRFDLLMVHSFLVFRVLEKHGYRGHQLSQKTVNIMFAAFDDAVRGLGVGDMAVPRRMKSMAFAFAGRAAAYSEALTSGDPSKLKEALARNLYGGAAVDPAMLDGMTDYVMREVRRLETLSLDQFMAGDLRFPTPERAP